MARRTKTLRLKPELIEAIDDLAKKENRNFNNVVETLLEKCVKFSDLILSLK